MPPSALHPSGVLSVSHASDASPVASKDFDRSHITEVGLKMADSYRGYDHVTWYVGNAKQAASYFITRMGFQLVAYRGLETGSRIIASHVVSNNRVVFVLTSPIRGPDFQKDDITEEDRQLLGNIHTHLSKHGDAVKDVAFKVDDVEAVYEAAVRRGAVIVQEPICLSGVTTAVISTYGDTTHTLVNRTDQTGFFMPGYRAVIAEDPIAKCLPMIPLEVIDHCVGNQDWDQMQAACD